MSDTKAVLITGAAQRLGATTARTLHAAGLNIAIHYRNSDVEAKTLSQELNATRTDSCIALQADLNDLPALDDLVSGVTKVWGRLDVLINNASSFYPTPVGEITQTHWDELMGSNLKAPLFLSQAATPALKTHQGCIINMIDIHAYRPLAQHPVYCAAKAGLMMLTMSLARELGPHIRVNGIAPGAIMWPDSGLDASTQDEILSRTALKRQGSPQDIANTARFLILDADYITGQIINVDGGRSIHG